MSAPTAETLRESLRPLTDDPERAAIFCDIDGTLAPIVRRPEEAHVREEISLLLSRLGRRYGCVACVSGRPVAEARRLVGVGSIAYAGAHGAELLHAGEKKSTLAPAFASWEPRVRRFVHARENVRELRLLRIRIEDKGPIKAFHWRDVPDEAEAERWLSNVAQEAEAEGFATHWGRKVLEIRPPVPIGKGQAVRTLIEETGVRAALFAGDDVTDLDAFDALDALQTDGALDTAVRVGVRSTEGPPAIVERADMVVDGVRGMVDVLAALAE
ncbi:MAG TPA: trehalose-phosphatase [Thermoleophilaceae bacterium]|nr:trehalose-phosphatase [Thermoleophilaceae bacterium]